MTNPVRVIKSPITDHWMVADLRIFWPFVAAHNTYPEAIRHAHAYAVAQAEERARRDERIAAAPARGRRGDPW